MLLRVRTSAHAASRFFVVRCGCTRSCYTKCVYNKQCKESHAQTNVHRTVVSRLTIRLRIWVTEVRVGSRVRVTVRLVLSSPVPFLVWFGFAFLSVTLNIFFCPACVRLADTFSTLYTLCAGVRENRHMPTGGLSRTGKLGCCQSVCPRGCLSACLSVCPSFSLSKVPPNMTGKKYYLVYIISPKWLRTIDPHTAMIRGGC